MRAPLGVLMESRAGDISASCLTDLKLQSVAGAVSMLRKFKLWKSVNEKYRLGTILFSDLNRTSTAVSEQAALLLIASCLRLAWLILRP